MKMIDADALKVWLEAHRHDEFTPVIEHIDAMPDGGCAAQAELDRLRDKYRMAWEYARFALDIIDPEAKAKYIDEIWRVMEGEG